MNKMNIPTNKSIHSHTNIAINTIDINTAAGGDKSMRAWIAASIYGIQHAGCGRCWGLFIRHAGFARMSQCHCIQHAGCGRC